MSSVGRSVVNDSDYSQPTRYDPAYNICTNKPYEAERHAVGFAQLCNSTGQGMVLFPGVIYSNGRCLHTYIYCDMGRHFLSYPHVWPQG